MKIVFLSAALFIYGYFCDICLLLCEKNVHKKLRKGKPLTGEGLVFMSNFANNNLLRWQRIEKKLILSFALKQNS